MKEKEFLRRCVEEFEGHHVKVDIFFRIDENLNVILDFESMKEEFEEKLNQISNLLEGDKES